MRTLGVALVGLALLFAATLAANRLPAAKNAQSDEFSAVRALNILSDLVGNGIPHPIGSAANAHLRDSLVRRLTQLNYRVELQTGLSCNRYGICGSPTNIIATPPNFEPSNNPDTVLLAAHYDSVPAGPGAGDDGAGVAAVMEIARILISRPSRHPVILLLSDGEEAGLLGALLFVREHPLAHTVKAAVNLEGRGDSGPSLMFETGSANTWLMKLYGASVARPMTDSLFYVVYRALPNDTDFTAFKAAGYQGFNFAYVGHVGRYHTTLDTVANLSPRTLQHHGDNALSAVIALANAENLQATPSDAVFTDVFSRALWVWPASANLIVAAAALLLLMAEAAMLRRRGQVALPQIAWGAVGALTTSALALLVAALMTALVWFVDQLPLFAWIAHPQGVHLACAALVLVAVAVNGAWMAKRGQFWGTWLGCALLLAALSMVLSLTLPGASFIVLVPAVAAALAAAPSAWGRSGGVSRVNRSVAVLAPLWVAMLVGAPIISLCYSALGILSWPVITLLLSLSAMLLLPLLARNEMARTTRRLLGISAAAAFAGLAVALILPTYSAQWPQRLSFQYRLDSDAHRAFWIADPSSRVLPAKLTTSASFNPKSQPEFAGSAAQVYFAPAPLRTLDAPQLAVVESASRPEGGSHYRLHLQSPRRAPEAFVVFPAAAGVQTLRVATPSGESPTPLHEMRSGATFITFVGLPADGVDFEIDAPAEGVAVQVFDQSFELPGGEFLQRMRGPDAASSQDGDVTVVQHTVTLVPAAGR
jgi:Peptidase family M28